MSVWMISAYGFTMLLLVGGVCLTIFEFQRAGARMRKADARIREQRERGADRWARVEIGGR